MDKKSLFQVGGNIESAVKGDFKINVQAILKEAWGKSPLSRLSINSGLLFIFSLAITLAYLVSNYLGGIDAVLADENSSMILNIIVTLFIWPFLAGIEMMGVFNAVGIKIQPKLIFAFLKQGSWVAICALLTSLLISIGLQLLILPGVFLAVVLSLTIPLLIDKKLSPIQAIILSVKALRFHWFKIFYLYLILLFLLVLILMPLALLAQTSFSIIGVVIFFFGLSYLAPLYYNVKGILYREIFGLQLESVDINTLHKNHDSNDTFSA